jgi:hypothetical protein
MQRVDRRGEHHRGEADGDDEAGHRQGVDGELVLPEFLELQVEGGLEEEPREEDRVEQLFREVRRLEVLGDAEGEPRHDQRHGVRHLEPPRREGHRGGHQKQRNQYDLHPHDGPQRDAPGAPRPAPIRPARSGFRAGSEAASY